MISARAARLSAKGCCLAAITGWETSRSNRMPHSGTFSLKKRTLVNPDLYEYRILPLGGTPVLVNRRRDGHLEVTDELAFHGGVGATLEMRQFTVAALYEKLLASGFTNVRFFNEN